MELYQIAGQVNQFFQFLVKKVNISNSQVKVSVYLRVTFILNIFEIVALRGADYHGN